MPTQIYFCIFVSYTLTICALRVFSSLEDNRPMREIRQLIASKISDAQVDNKLSEIRSPDFMIEFWSALLKRSASVRKTLPFLLVHHLRKGVPTVLRAEIWPSLLATKSSDAAEFVQQVDPFPDIDSSHDQQLENVIQVTTDYLARQRIYALPET